MHENIWSHCSEFRWHGTKEQVHDAADKAGEALWIEWAQLDDTTLAWYGEEVPPAVEQAWRAGGLVPGPAQQLSTAQQFGAAETSQPVFLLPNWCIITAAPSAMSTSAALGTPASAEASTACQPEQHATLIVPPGAGFGDGVHPSTRLAAQALNALRECGGVRDQQVLDLGCGSGVLAALARRLGAARVDATDVDPAAVRHAETVFSLNRLTACQAWVSDGLASISGSYDIVVANVYGPFICSWAKEFARVCQGPLIVSGISDQHAQETEEALLAAGWNIAVTYREAPWRAWCLSHTSHTSN
jgi:ribosomal protein L11 methylase PrmA